MRSVLARRRVFGRHSAGAHGLLNARRPISVLGHDAHHARDAGLGQRSPDVPAGAASPCNADCHTGVTTTAASATNTAPVAGTQTAVQTQSAIFTYAPAGGGQGSFTRASDSSTSAEATESTPETAELDSATYFTTSSEEEPGYTDVEASSTFSIAPTSSPAAASDPEPTTRSTKSSSGQNERTAYTLSSSHTSSAAPLSESSSLASSSAATAQTSSAATAQTSSAATSQPTTSNTAALAGGIIGGLVGLGLLILVVMFVKRRQQRPRSMEIGKLAPSQAFMRENSDARSRYVANGASFARIDSRDEQGEGSVRAPTPAWMHPRAKTPESTKTFLNLD